MDFLPIWAFWLAFALLLFAAEIVTTGFFLFPFGIAALVGGSLLWQWAVFLVVSAVFLVFSRRLARTFDRGPGQRAGPDRLIGMQGVVLEEIDPVRNVGAVRVDNESWRAEPSGAATIPAGAHVTVLAIRGARVVVEPRDT